MFTRLRSRSSSVHSQFALLSLPSGLRLLVVLPGGDASHRRGSFTGRTMRCAPRMDHPPGQGVPTSRTPSSVERCSTPLVRICTRMAAGQWRLLNRNYYQILAYSLLGASHSLHVRRVLQFFIGCKCCFHSFACALRSSIHVCIVALVLNSKYALCLSSSRVAFFFLVFL